MKRLALLVALAPLACSGSIPDTDVVAEVALLDVNPNSATYGDAVSPRDHLGHITAWYFGSSS